MHTTEVDMLGSKHRTEKGMRVSKHATKEEMQGNNHTTKEEMQGNNHTTGNRRQSSTYDTQPRNRRPLPSCSHNVQCPYPTRRAQRNLHCKSHGRQMVHQNLSAAVCGD